MAGSASVPALAQEGVEKEALVVDLGRGESGGDWATAPAADDCRTEGDGSEAELASAREGGEGGVGGGSGEGRGGEVGRGGQAPAPGRQLAPPVAAAWGWPGEGPRRRAPLGCDRLPCSSLGATVTDKPTMICDHSS